MIRHPDADAFMRVYLRDPTDVTTRLVFADWLEETGESSNVAWGRYIRAKAEAARRRFGSSGWAEREAEAAGHAWRIRANLTIPAARFIDYPRSLLQLLPAPNITVRLSEFEAPREITDCMPESIARDYLALLLDIQEPAYLIATTNPHNCDDIDQLRFLLNRDIVAVRASWEDIHLALARHYAVTEYQSFDSLVLEFVDMEI